MSQYIENLIAETEAKNPAQPEFIQAVEEVAESLDAVLQKEKKYRDAKILERIVEPERVIMFRVPWLDDKGEVQINRGFRIEFNSAIGPYKGGLRFHPTVNLGILKFLAFEQVFKNSLTTLPMGGGKGGSDFDPKGKSDNEVMRFCQSFMTELSASHRPDHRRPRRRHRRGRPRDRLPVRAVQAHPQRVHRRAHRQGLQLGRLASFVPRPPATAPSTSPQEMLATRGETLKGKICLVSGSGNVAQYTVEKINSSSAARSSRCPTRTARSTTRPASTAEKLAFVMELKNVKRGRIKEYADKFRARSSRRRRQGSTPVGHQVRLRLPVRHAERDQRRGRQDPA